MLTSPLAAASKTENWPTLGRPKENPIFAQTDSIHLKSNNGLVNDREKLPGANIEHSDEDSVDFALGWSS